MMMQRVSGVSIVGFGCSSFSTFFDDNDVTHCKSSNPNNISSTADYNTSCLELNDLTPSNSRVKGWIDTLCYAIEKAGITVLDTAPWYGHGISEVVVGFALEVLLMSTSTKRKRSDLVINTKVGRYEADLARQFNFSRDTTLNSVQRSLQRLNISYIDVLQLHDPEFAPSFDILFQETIPAMLQAKSRGWCRKLGLTGYPLSVQHHILIRSLDLFGENIWDQSLVYSHFNLHDSSLFDSTILVQNVGHEQLDHQLKSEGAESFASLCQRLSTTLFTAAPLSMGLLTTSGPPRWHPAHEQLKAACLRASELCTHDFNINISHLALLYALSHPAIPCTLVGLCNIPHVQMVQEIAARVELRLPPIQEEKNASNCLSHEEILRELLTPNEWQAYVRLNDPIHGPFAQVWKNGTFQWDGLQLAREFWKELLLTAKPHNEEVTIIEIEQLQQNNEQV